MILCYFAMARRDKFRTMCRLFFPKSFSRFFWRILQFFKRNGHPWIKVFVWLSWWSSDLGSSAAPSASFFKWHLSYKTEITPFWEQIMSLWTQIAALWEQNLIAFRDTNNWHILKSTGLDPELWAYPLPPPQKKISLDPRINLPPPKKSPPPQHLLKLCRKRKRNNDFNSNPNPLPHHHPYHKVNRPPNLSVKKKKQEIMFFRAVDVSGCL